MPFKKSQFCRDDALSDAVCGVNTWPPSCSR